MFAFAAYHQLESGEPVTGVVRRDGAGHHADEDAIRELSEAGLVTVEANRVNFSDQGEAVLGALIGALRTVGGPSLSRPEPRRRRSTSRAGPFDRRAAADAAAASLS